MLRFPLNIHDEKQRVVSHLEEKEVLKYQMKRKFHLELTIIETVSIVDTNEILVRGYSENFSDEILY
jgi:hypothetical protein